MHFFRGPSRACYEIFSFFAVFTQLDDSASLSLKTQVEQASTASKGMVPLKDIPQIVNVVPQQVLKEQNVTSLQGALQNVTGLSFSVGDGQRDQVMIRGFSAISDQYVDGVRDDALYYRDLSSRTGGSAKRARLGVICPRFSRRPADQPDQ